MCSEYFDYLSLGEGYIYINKGSFENEKEELSAYLSIPVKRENAYNYEKLDLTNYVYINNKFQNVSESLIQVKNAYEKKLVKTNVDKENF